MIDFLRDLYHAHEGARFLIVFVCFVIWWVSAIAQSVQPI